MTDPACGRPAPAVTAETITDEQIRELRLHYTHPTGEVQRDVDYHCEWSSSTIPSVRGVARAWLANAWNVLAKERP